MGDFTDSVLNPTATPALTKEDMAAFVLRGGQALSAATVPDQLREIGTNTF